MSKDDQSNSSTPKGSALSSPSASKANQQSYLDYFISAGIGFPQGFITALVTQPLYNAKILEQTTPARGGLNMGQAFAELAKNRRLYAGFDLSILKLAISNGLINPLMFCADRSFSKEFVENNPLTSSVFKASLVTLPKIALIPFDTILTNKVDSGMSAKEIFTAVEKQPTLQQKAALLYRGAALEGGKSLIGLSMAFLARDQMADAKKIITQNGDSELSAFDTMFAGMFAGGLKIAATQPLDTIAKVQQSGVKPQTVLEAINTIDERARKAQSSIMKVLYRGSLPKAISGGFTTAASLLMLDMMDYMAKARESNKDAGSSRY